MKKLLTLLWLSLSCLVGEAAVLTADDSQVNLLGSTQYLEDPSGGLTLDQVRGMDGLFRHWEGGGTQLNFGFTPSAYWIRAPLQRTDSAPEDWLLEVHYTKIEQLDFYPSQGPMIRTGSSQSLSTRPYYDRNFVFPVALSTSAEYVYLRVKSNYPLTVPLTLWQGDAFRQQQQGFQMLQFMYYGALSVLALYGMLIYAGLRDVRFFLYSSYISFAGLAMLASNGYGRQLLWPDGPAFDDISQTLLFSLAALFAAVFARQILLPDERKDWLRIGLRVSEALFILCGGLAVVHLGFPLTLGLASQLLFVSGLVMAVLVSVAGLQLLDQHRPGVLFFMMGWLVLTLGVATATFRAFGWVPSNGFTFYVVQWATLVEMVFLALTLADILRHEHQSLIFAQAQALQANQSLLKFTQASEEKLKTAVRERTSQLEASLKLEKGLREQYVRFGSMISHEFRTPLSIIQSQASLMRREHERGLNQVSKRLEAIGSATQRLTVMFDKWLHSDALTHSLEVLDQHPLELHPWLRTLVHTNQHLLLNHAVDLQLHLAQDRAVADEYHLGVALTNLIDNAAKYAPPETTITLQTCRKPGYVGLAVTDQGPGIPVEVQDKVFDEFFRVSPESRVRGVGLGLSIVQRIARAHGGHVTLQSTPGQGATFTFWLTDPLFKDAT